MLTLIAPTLILAQVVLSGSVTVRGTVTISGGEAFAISSLFDTYANIAATPCNSGNSGQVAFTTSIYTARCNGTTWDWFWRGMPVTPPPQTGWTIDGAMGAAQISTADGTATFHFPAKSTGQLSLAYRAGSSGNETITALVCTVFGDVFFGSADATTDPASSADALGLRDSAGKISAFFWTNNVANTYFSSLDYWPSSSGFMGGQAFSYPNAGEGGPSSFQLQKETNQDCHWFRVIMDASNHSWRYNYSGSPDNWVQFILKPKNEWLGSGAHDPGLVIYTNRVGARATIVSWKQE